MRPTTRRRPWSGGARTRPAAEPISPGGRLTRHSSHSAADTAAAEKHVDDVDALFDDEDDSDDAPRPRSRRTIAADSDSDDVEVVEVKEKLAFAEPSPAKRAAAAADDDADLECRPKKRRPAALDSLIDLT